MTLAELATLWARGQRAATPETPMPVPASSPAGAGDDHLHLPVLRPKTRGDCANSVRPCPWVGCRYHLYLTVARDGAITIHHPDLEPWELEESCALDVATRGGVKLDMIGKVFRVTRERIRQIEASAIRKVARSHPRMRDLLDRDRQQRLGAPIAARDEDEDEAEDAAVEDDE